MPIGWCVSMVLIAPPGAAGNLATQPAGRVENPAAGLVPAVERATPTIVEERAAR